MFGFSLCCFMSKPQRLEGDMGQKARPNFALSPLPDMIHTVKVRGEVGEMTESISPVWPMTKPLIYSLFWWGPTWPSITKKHSTKTEGLRHTSGDPINETKWRLALHCHLRPLVPPDVPGFNQMAHSKDL